MTHREGPRSWDGAVLVRVRARGPGWARRLPPVPGARVLTVTVGHPSLLPVPAEDLVGYRIVGIAQSQQPVGVGVDVLVPAELRDEEPEWWARLLTEAERVFDLRMGPVRAVLGPDLDLHRAATV